MLVIVAFCGVMASIVVQRGQNVFNTLLFLTAVGGFFLLGWVVSRLQIGQIKVDENALHTSALWGLVRRSYKWREIERLEPAS